MLSMTSIFRALGLLLLGLFWLGAGAEAHAAVINAVHSGTATFPGGENTLRVTMPSVDRGRAFLVFSAAMDSVNPADGQISGQLTAAEEITFRRAGNANVTAALSWQVIEYSQGVSVQRGTTEHSNVTNVNVNLPNTVNTTRAFILTSYRSGGVIYSEGDFVRTRFRNVSNGNSSSLQFDTQDGGESPAFIEWQVVEMDNIQVEHQSTTLQLDAGQTSRSATLTSTVDPTKAWLVYHYRANDTPANNSSTQMVRGGITGGGSSVTFTRASQDGQVTIQVAYSVIRFTDGTTVQSGSTAFASGSVTQSEPVVVTANRSFVFGGLYGRGGQTAYSTDANPGSGWFTTTLANPTTLTINRATSGNANATFDWFVVTPAEGGGVPVGAPRRLAFITPSRTLTVGECNGAARVVTVGLYDDQGNNIAAPTGGIDVALATSASGSGTFYTDEACTAVASGASFRIAEGARWVDVYYRDTLVGAPTLSVTNGSGLDNPAAQPQRVVEPGAEGEAPLPENPGGGNGNGGGGSQLCESPPCEDAANVVCVCGAGGGTWLGGALLVVAELVRRRRRANRG